MCVSLKNHDKLLRITKLRFDTIVKNFGVIRIILFYIVMVKLKSLLSHALYYFHFVFSCYFQNSSSKTKL